MDLEHKPQFVPQKCPVCNASQESLSYFPISGDEQKTVIHLNCRKCHINVFACAQQSEMGIVTIGVLTDLSSLEAREISREAMVTGDDVLALHHMLNDKESVSIGEFLATS